MHRRFISNHAEQSSSKVESTQEKYWLQSYVFSDTLCYLVHGKHLVKVRNRVLMPWLTPLDELIGWNLFLRIKVARFSTAELSTRWYGVSFLKPGLSQSCLLRVWQPHSSSSCTLTSFNVNHFPQFPKLSPTDLSTKLIPPLLKPSKIFCNLLGFSILYKQSPYRVPRPL